MAGGIRGAGAGAQMALQAQTSIIQQRRLQEEIAMKQAQRADQAQFRKQLVEGFQALGEKPDMPTSLDKMAEVAIGTGRVQQAADFSNKAALLRARMASASLRGMQATDAQVTAGKNSINLLGQFIQGATDQKSWDRGNALFTRMTGQRSPYAGLPYDPKLVGELQQQAVSVKQMADITAKERNQQTLDATRQSAIDFRNQRLKILQKEQELRAAHRAQLGKVGGKVVGAPAKGEVEESAMMLKKAYDNLPDEEIASHAYVVASRARALRIANPGLDAATSMGQAMTELNLKNPPGFLDGIYGLFGSKGEAAPTGALPLPTKKEELKVGQDYVTARGVGKWNGQGFELMPAGAQPLVQGIPPMDEGDLDEGEE